MCQMRIVKETAGVEEQLFEDVTRLEVTGEGRLAITSLFGGTAEVEGQIQIIDFNAGRLVIRQNG